MVAAYLSGITNVKKFFVVIINFIHNLEQHHLVQLICDVRLHSTLFVPNLFTYTPKMVWCRFNTLRPRQMAAIFQTTFSKGFSWMKIFEFRSKFHWNLFLRVQLTIFQHWFRSWLGANQATSHYLNQWLLDCRHIYASLGLNELTCPEKVWYEITYPFPNFNGAAIEVWESLSNFTVSWM